MCCFICCLYRLVSFLLVRKDFIELLHFLILVNLSLENENSACMRIRWISVDLKLSDVLLWLILQILI